MRSDKELLEILLHYIPIRIGWSANTNCSMCGLIETLYIRDSILTQAEAVRLLKVIKSHSHSRSTFWFPMCEPQPRIEWLTEVLKKY